MIAKTLRKAVTGIAGFDEITGGGLPAGRTTLVTGGPGSGKTIFALQTLVSGAAAGEPGIFVAFEESAANIRANTSNFRWDFAKANERLFWLERQVSSDMDVSGEFDLQGLLAALSAKVEETGATRIVFDSLDVLLALLGNADLAVREVRRLQEWLSGRELTAILTAKASARTQEILEPFGFIEFMVDCAVALDHVVTGGVSHRSIRVVKYRGSSFQENLSPMVIGEAGLEVASPLSRQIDPELVFDERISSGIADLDHMFTGGYYRGSSVLITGAPGTAKSTLCGAFAEAACRRGEPTLFVSFDSDPYEIERNLSSVGIDLATCRQGGLLKMYSSRANASSAEVHLLTITCLARDHGARCIVVDPISALGKADSGAAGLGVTERLIDWAKHRGITVLCTSLLSSGGPIDAESTSMHISTIADTWLHLSYVVNAGERNRALTIVKSRGTAHSNQVRELVLSGEGLSLTQVYTAEGQVLMGTMRWQKERADRIAQARQQQALELRARAIAGEREELRTRLAALKKEVELKDAELDLLQQASAGNVSDEQARRDAMLHLRGGSDSGPA
jgi:circadian clock protein KaiC